MFESIVKEKLNDGHLTKEQKELRNRFLIELENAVDKYGDNHIDIGLNREADVLYAYYHSRHDSFPVTKDYPAVILTDNELDVLTQDTDMCWGKLEVDNGTDD